MSRLFGTDGIRAPFGQEPLDRATVAALGRALGEELCERSCSPVVVLAGDTRSSTPILAAWLAEGLFEHGVAVRFAGVLPTPAVAALVPRLGAACGIAVSASHNLPPDNGIKLIDAAGFKWAPEREAALEKRLLALRRQRPSLTGEPPALTIDPDLAELYRRQLLGHFSADQPLSGLSIALDAAHGAASGLAADLFSALGATVRLLHAEPDGTNINLHCGSTHPEALAAVVRDGHDLGIAFDGDADRAILVDEHGQVRDGDAILYLWATALRREGSLSPPAIVATTMSNLGLERALAREGIAVERCNVGDREVVARLQQEGLLLGGEQSGHVVHLGLATTGDGLLTGLAMAVLRAREGRPLSALLEGFQRFPQVLENVRVRRKQDLTTLPPVVAAMDRAERSLGQEGRLVVRFSGTEPLARVMIEGPDAGEIAALAAGIVTAIKETLG
ncbi:MAG TPA: phosphoglucosamine mutase [Thermoanaerobaculia bacterium]|nr:phosphoglucosamine mutase [Thermoanaerobaculia bacterium]